MKFYRVCDICGAHLDPGENCDCKIESIKNNKITSLIYIHDDDFIRFEKNHIKKVKKLKNV